jgi:hypothetical protein
VEERLLRDARRFYSLPGGAPAPNWLYVEKRGYTLIEPTARDFLAEVAFRVSKKERRVVDLAPRLGCACSGVMTGKPWAEARETVAACEPPRAVHEVLDHDVPLDLSAPIEPWTGSTGGGAPTIPITLDALAGMYDPDQKAEPVRVTPPPLRRAFSRQEPPTPTFISGSPLANATPVDSETVGTSNGARSPNGEPKTRPIPESASAEPRTEPRTIEPRTSGARTMEPRTGEPRTGPIPEPRTVPLPRFRADYLWDEAQFQFNQFGLFRRILTTIGVVIVAGVGIALAQRALATYVPKTSGPEASPVASPVAAPAAPPTQIAPAASNSNEPLDTTAVAPLPPDPNLPRLPIGPSGSNGVPLIASPNPEQAAPLGGSHFKANPAPVYTLGAAPIPRAMRSSADAYNKPVFPLVTPVKPGQGASITSSDDLPPPLALRPAGSPPNASEAIAIRLEILRRRRRADSLKHVVDSLGERLKP